MLHTGEQDGYFWLVAPSEIPLLGELAVRFHQGMHLCITAFDSGPILPTDDETAEGWHLDGNVMVSAPLSGGVVIPHDQYHEWYIIKDPKVDWVGNEVFVNYCGFTLVSPDETYKTYDPTWDRRGLDWVLPIQARFWSQLKRLGAESYVAVGDNDIVVSRNQAFIQAVRDAA